MRSRALVPIVALGLLAACATPFQARVSRFQQLPPPSGQTFVVQPVDKAKAGSLEFQTYAAQVTQRLSAVGFQPATDPQAATLVVNLDYGVGQPRERIDTRPGTGFGFGYGFSPFYRPWGFYPSRFYGGFGLGGFYDPFWGPGFGAPEVYSFTEYPAYLTMRINRTADNQAVFEGRAEARARSNDLTRLVPNLVTAMFQNFPGNSGETVRVSVPQNTRS